MAIDWVGGWAPEDLYFDDYPRPIFRGYIEGCQIGNGAWCPILLKQKKYHWMDFDKDIEQQECTNKNCAYRRKNKKDGFKCLYIECHQDDKKKEYTIILDHHQTFNKYNIIPKTKFSMSSADLDKLVRDYFPKLTGNIIYKAFNSVNSFLWNKGSEYIVLVKESEIKEDSDYFKCKKLNLINGKSPYEFFYVMYFLCEYKILPFGLYEVKVL